MSLDFTHPLAVSVRKRLVAAVSDFGLIKNGDRIMVCVSGGKDSSVLLALLTEIRRRAPYRFEVVPVILDQKQPGFQVSNYQSWIAEELGLNLVVLEKNTYAVVIEKVKSGTYCSLCSRLRRGVLYDYASEQGFHKMALGHHREDLNETLLLNLFFTGKISAMPPILRSDDGRNVVIRPLCYVPEEELSELAGLWKIPLIPCRLCGSQEGLQRARVKDLIRDLSRDIPQIANSLLAAQGHVHESQLLDRRLWDFVKVGDLQAGRSDELGATP
ncbi:MAG: tRNA 2-thiocytidine(32) synthetase TtcA [Bdellovibrio sp.]|nr:MAG: tRNA 2-thiocytidine(32) synthetase TtcA [Bdellovibrio sp.]